MRRPAATRTLPGELTLLEAIRRQAGASGAGSRALRLGIGDDCALLRPKPGYELCVTTDFSLEGVHFRRAWHPPESVGHRCLARGLSDLAAMGAEPVAVFLSLALPGELPAGWFRRFLNGFLALAAQHRVPLAGGDTAQSPALTRKHAGPILADIVAIGQVPNGQALLRSGARPGDGLYVTGALGGAAAELRSLSRDPRAFHALRRAGRGQPHPHLFPEPRLAVGRRLRGLAHGCIDLSDGLSTDLTHLCEASCVAAIVEEAALPIHPLASAPQVAAPGLALDLALHGGEDYELLFAASPAVGVPRAVGGVPVHRIGTVRRPVRGQPTIVLETRSGGRVAMEAGGWEHFRRQPTQSTPR